MIIEIALAGPSRIPSVSDNEFSFNRNGDNIYSLIYRGEFITRFYNKLDLFLYNIVKNKKQLLFENRTKIYLNMSTEQAITTLTKAYREILGYIFGKISNSPIIVNKDGIELCINLPNICVSRELFMSTIDLIMLIKDSYVNHKNKFIGGIVRGKRRRATTKFNIWMNILKHDYPHIWKLYNISSFFRLIKQKQHIYTARKAWKAWKFDKKIPEQPVDVDYEATPTLTFMDAISRVGL